MEDSQSVAAVRRWVELMVVGMNLCPFAKRELVKQRLRFVETAAQTEAELLTALRTELELLDADASIETTLLIHPQVLQEFYDYNRFLGQADRLLRRLGWEGVYQIASFHPDYQFGEAGSNDVENCSNRSPYPLLHLLREESLERAIAEYPDVEQIPERNIALMNRLGEHRLRALMQACLNGEAEGEP